MRKHLKLRETITTPKLKGIFIKLAQLNISDSDVFDFISDNKIELNVDYYDIYSLDKMASQYFNKKIDGDILFIDDDDAIYIDDNDYLSIDTSYDDIYDDLAKIIHLRYGDKWDRIFKALVLEDYEALENYNMVEIRTPNLTDTRTLDLLNTLSRNSSDNRTLNFNDNRTINTRDVLDNDRTDTRTLNTEDELTIDKHTDDKNSIKTDTTSTESVNRFGFNDSSSSGSPYEKKTINNTGDPLNNYADRDIDEDGTETTTHTGTDTLVIEEDSTTTHTGTDNVAHTGTDNVAHSGSDTSSDEGTDTTTHTGTEQLTRHGNIGVTTSQQMLESELKLRALYNMVYIIYDDIDKVLTNPIFIN